MAPSGLHRQLMAAYKNSAIDNDGWFPIHDEKTNVRLCEMFGLTTDYAEYQIGNVFRLRFGWNVQLWYVG